MLTLAAEIIGHVPADSDKASRERRWVTAAEQIDTSIHTDETVGTFEEALNEAKAVLANVVTQSTVDAAEKSLAYPGGIGAQDGAVCLRV